MSVFGGPGETPEERAQRIVRAEAAEHRGKVLQREARGSPKRAGDEKASTNNKKQVVR